MTPNHKSAIERALEARPMATRDELGALVRELAAVGIGDQQLATLLELDRASVCAAIAGSL